MSIYDRLLGLVEPKIPVHQFMSLIGEYNRGKLTAGEIIVILNLDAGEQGQIATLLAKAVPPVETISLGSLITLTNIGASYDAIAASQGLPMARVQTAGITSLEFTVRVNKIGSGTQSWQLWNETDAAETTVINDSGAAGIKILTVTRDFPSPLGPALKTFRIRAKSTTAADDPAFLGGCVMITRQDRLTQDVLHEILLLAEMGWAYATESLLKTRLGV